MKAMHEITKTVKQMVIKSIQRKSLRTQSAMIYSQQVYRVIQPLSLTLESHRVSNLRQNYQVAFLSAHTHPEKKLNATQICDKPPPMACWGHCVWSDIQATSEQVLPEQVTFQQVPFFQQDPEGPAESQRVLAGLVRSRQVPQSPNRQRELQQVTTGSYRFRQVPTGFRKPRQVSVDPSRSR